MNEYNLFKKKCNDNIAKQASNEEVNNTAREFMRASFKFKYPYNFEFLGRPIIQYPQDIIAMQEIIWEVKPDLIIETGIAHGGSLIMSASMLALLDLCEAAEAGKLLNPNVTNRMVLGIDVDIRKHNREAILSHPMSSRIKMIEGSSIDSNVVKEVKKYSQNFNKILVCLDSNHTHEHVLKELNFYATLTSKDSYCVVFDTIIEDLPKDMFPDRPWCPGNNAKTAVLEFLKKNNSFEIDTIIQNKLLITVSPDGYLKRTRI